MAPDADPNTYFFYIFGDNKRSWIAVVAIVIAAIMNESAVDSMQNALAAGNKAAKASQFVLYPDAPHAFHADYRPSYRKEAAADGFKRALEWFKTNGVA